MKRKISIILAICMLLGMIMPTVPVLAAASGNCGTNLTWTLDKNGVLTISGTGAMVYENYGWQTYTISSKVNELVIEDGVTTVSRYAFDGFSNLETVKIANTVTTIENHAFYECKNLKNVDLGEGLVKIGGFAFSTCNSLKSIEIPDSVIKIDDYAFYESEYLSDVKFGSNLITIGNAAFTDCFLTDLEIPDSVISIGDRAFSSNAFKTVKIGKKVKTIGESAFYYNYSLTSIEIPDSVKTIGFSAFDSCSNLKNVYYSGSKNEWENITINNGNEDLLNAIISYAKKNIEIISSGECGEKLTWKLDENGLLTISGKGAMENYSSSSPAPWEAKKSNIKKVVIEEGITTIGDNAFYGCLALSSIDFPNSIISIGDYAFYSCSNLKNAWYNGFELEWNSFVNVGEGNDILSDALFDFAKEGYEVAAIEIENMPDKVEYILGEEFDKTGLKVNVLYKKGFGSGLTDEEVKAILRNGMYENNEYWDVVYNALLNLETARVLEEISGFSSKVYDYEYQMRMDEARSSIIYNLEKGLTEGSRYWNTAYPAISKAAGVRIQTNNFSVLGYDKEKLGYQTLSVEFVGKTAQLEVAVKPSILADVVASGRAGTKITWNIRKNGLLIIEGTGLMPDYILDRPAWFEYSDIIKNVLIKEGIISIGIDAFIDMEIESVVIPCSVKRIASGAFGTQDAKLTDVYYVGNQSSWSLVNVETGYNQILDYVTLHYGDNSSVCYASGACGEKAEWQLYSDGNLVISGTGPMYDYSNLEIPWKYVKKIEIAEGITEIGKCAFAGTEITKVTLPASVTKIDDFAFYNCSNLKEIIYNGWEEKWNKQTYIGDCNRSIASAKLSIKGTKPVVLESIELHRPQKSEYVKGEELDLTGLKVYALYDNGTRTEITGYSVSSFNSSVLGKQTITVNYQGKTAKFTVTVVEKIVVDTNISVKGVCGPTLDWSISKSGVLTISGTGKMYDFANTSEIPWYKYKSQINSLVIEGGITYIGSRAFRDLSITEAIIPEGVTSTGSSVFNNCLNLKIVSLPSSLKNLGNYFVYNCDALVNIDFSYVETIGSNAAANCGKLWEVVFGRGLKSIGKSAFASSARLSHVFYAGDETEWKKVTIEADNEPLTSARFKFNEVVLKSITIIKPEKLVYVLGEDIDLSGLIVYGLYSDGTEKIAEMYTVTGFDSNKTGVQTLTVSYKEKNTTFTVEVKEKEVLDEIVASGSCGDTLNWSIDDKGMLKISGTGKMNDFANTSEIPWYAYKSQIKSLVIEEGITYIGNRAFRDLLITEATIPEGVTATGTSVFNNCTKLNSVTLPQSLKNIANYFLYNCDALVSIDISYAETIGTNAFATCGALAEIKLGADLKSIGASAFASSTKIKDVYYASSETLWKKVSIGSGNTSLTSATIHFGEASEVVLESIEIKAPEKLQYIEGEELDLTGLKVYAVYSDGSKNEVAKYTVSGYDSALTGEQTVVVEYNGKTAEFVVTVLKKDAEIIASGDCGTNATWKLDENGLLVISGTGAMAEYGKDVYPPWYAEYSELISNVIIEEGITTVGSNAFCMCKSIVYVNIGNTVTKIGANAFFGCEKLGSIEIPDSVAIIGKWAFSNCSMLKNVKLGSGIKTIDLGAFNGCNALEKVSYNGSYDKWNNNVSVENDNISLLNAPISFDNQEVILVKIEISKPKKLQYSLGETLDLTGLKVYAVYSDGNKKEVTDYTVSDFNANKTGAQVLTVSHNSKTCEFIVIVKENIESASGVCGNNLNWSVDKAGVLTISGTGKMFDFAKTSEIPWHSYKSQIKSLVIEEGITYIGNRAFRDLLITEATIPEGVTETGSSVFNSCIKLEKVNLPSTLKNITSFFVYNCDALKTIDFKYVETLGSNSVANCATLAEVKFGINLKAMSSSVFALSTNITDVYFEGTEKQWNNVKIGLLNDPLYAATFHFAEEPKVPEIVVSKVSGKSGETVNVDVELKGNPGIINLMLELDYDTRYFKLVRVTDGGILGDFVHGNNMQKLPYVLSWTNDTITENITADGIIVTLAFEISKDAPSGSHEIKVSCDAQNGGAFDVDLSPVNFEIQNGGIELFANIVGDVNSDGLVNVLDRTYFARYLARWDGYETINHYGADVNGDGNVNTIDRTILARHLANWTGYEFLPYRVN